VLTGLLPILPLVAGIGIGHLLRRSGHAGQSEGEFVFRLVFLVCMPALLFTSLSRVDMTSRLGVFALAAPVVVAAGHLAGRAVARTGLFRGPQIPVLITACMMVNAAFTLPFVQALYGAEGVARVAVFDAVNAALTFTWAYSVAARGNRQRQESALLVGRLLRSPPLYAIAAGLVVNVSGTSVPAPVADVLDTFGQATGLLISLGIGSLVAPVRGELGRAGLIVGTRLGSGLVVGLALVALLDLSGPDAGTLLLLGVAPVAFVTVTFASLEHLDVPLATAALSLALLASSVLSLGLVLVAGVL
jgi:predicted permease